MLLLTRPGSPGSAGQGTRLRSPAPSLHFSWGNTRWPGLSLSVESRPLWLLDCNAEAAFIPELWPHGTRAGECQTRWLSSKIWQGMNYIINVRGGEQPLATMCKESSSTLTRFQNKSSYLFWVILFLGCFEIELYFTNYFHFQNNFRGSPSFKKAGSNSNSWFAENESIIIFNSIHWTAFISSIDSLYWSIYQISTNFGFISMYLTRRINQNSSFKEVI